MSHSRKPKSQDVQFRQLMKGLTSLTAAINRMVESNEALIQTLLDNADQEEEDEGVPTYMDGTPIS